MSDNTTTSSKSWLEKLANILTGEPKNINELTDILRDAHERELLDLNSLNMIEGILDVTELRVKDVMVPKSQMIYIKQGATLEEIVTIITLNAHSRFPVLEENNDDVIGILLAKDIIQFSFDTSKRKSFNIEDVLRKAVFVPESKRLNILLQDFRKKRNHMAIVVDEYGTITGLVTIEDVLEQIVGEIEDEYDTAQNEMITKHKNNLFTLKAITPIDEFNRYFNTDIEDNEFETIGGLLMRQFGHLPKKGEIIEIYGFTFKILRADARRIDIVQVIPQQ